MHFAYGSLLLEESEGLCSSCVEHLCICCFPITWKDNCCASPPQDLVLNCLCQSWWVPHPVLWMPPRHRASSERSARKPLFAWHHPRGPKPWANRLATTQSLNFNGVESPESLKINSHTSIRVEESAESAAVGLRDIFLFLASIGESTRPGSELKVVLTAVDWSPLVKTL